MKNIHIKSVLLLLIIGGLVWVYACKKDEYSSRSPFGKSGFHARLTDENVIDPILDDLAKIIAIAQTNAGFRDILLDEAQLDIGLENLVLYFRIKDKVLPVTNIPVKKLFADISSQLNLSYDSAWFDCGIVQDLPQLNLNLVVTDDDIELSGLETWGLSLVLAATSDFEAEGEYLQTAYDYDLVTYQVSNNTEPEDQYIMGGNACPRFIVVENHTGLLIATNDWKLIDYSNITLNEMFGYPDSFPISPKLDSINFLNQNEVLIEIASCGFHGYYLILFQGFIHHVLRTQLDEEPEDEDGEICLRELWREYEQITAVKIKFAEIKPFCKWPAEFMNIKVVQMYAVDPSHPKVSNQGTKFVSVKRKIVKKNSDEMILLSEPQNLERWPYEDESHGSPYQILAVGDNRKKGQKIELNLSFVPSVKFKSGNTEISASISNTSYKVTIEQKDRELGDFLVEFCDDIRNGGTKYSTGLVSLWVRENCPR